VVRASLFLLGTIVNALAILVGAFVGIILPAFSERMKTTIMQGLSLAVIMIGLDMSLKNDQDILLVILSLVIGALLGEWINIEGGLERFGNRIEQFFVRNRSASKSEHSGSHSRSIAEGFVVASLVYCVGSMAIVGAIQSGLQGDHKTLFAKSILDGVSAVVFSSTLGVGVALSALPVFLYEGAMAAMAHFAGLAINSPEFIQCMTATGGLLIVGIGINIMGLKKIHVGNLLPAIFIAPLLKWVIIHFPTLNHIL
jgi:uncharacterized membrane protein YqgA involved in biofilm formation